MMLSRSGTFMDTMSSGSKRAGIPSCVSATSNACSEAKAGKRLERGRNINLTVYLHAISLTLMNPDKVSERRVSVRYQLLITTVSDSTNKNTFTFTLLRWPKKSHQLICKIIIQNHLHLSILLEVNENV